MTRLPGVPDNHAYCPICKGDPKHCPHSLSAMDNRAHLNWLAKNMEKKKKPIVVKKVEHDGHFLLLMSDNSVRWEYV